MPGCPVVVTAAGSLLRFAAGLRGLRAGEDVRALRTRSVADAGGAFRTFRPAFFFISADDSGTILEGTIIFAARRALCS